VEEVDINLVPFPFNFLGEEGDGSLVFLLPLRGIAAG
jgi:hypothetical protein